jgi:hypothetical protein
VWKEPAVAAPRLAAAALLLGLAHSPVPAADAAEPPSTLRLRIGCAVTRAALEHAAESAVRRLEAPECRQVFSDFKDAEGRLLRDKLEALGETAASYLTARMWFVDGSAARRCQESQTMAVTQPGSAVVFVCARQLSARGWRDPGLVEVALIHEELHSLGLGENPPSSQEISARVARRCGLR